jgi:hypothetical protein
MKSRLDATDLMARCCDRSETCSLVSSCWNSSASDLAGLFLPMKLPAPHDIRFRQLGGWGRAKRCRSVIRVGLRCAQPPATHRFKGHRVTWRGNELGLLLSPALPGDAFRRRASPPARQVPRAFPSAAIIEFPIPDPNAFMETSLHRALKSLYAGDGAQFEVALCDYRIDVVDRGRLVEIQHGSLAAIRDKIGRLLAEHEITVVKPIIRSRVLVKRRKEGGRVIERRTSPKHGTPLDLFDELVHFTRVFPHQRLTLDVPLVDIEEWRYPGHGRRHRWRRRDHQVEDQKLLAVHQTLRLRTTADLRAMVPCALPRPFHTGDLAEGLGIDRWIAQRIAYCLRQTGTALAVGKQGNTLLYEFAEP